VRNARFIYLDPASRDFFTDWTAPPTTVKTPADS